ncbi:MAG: sensor histidine kinase [Sulfurimonas sp.]|nr:sensor histidine kinase [Sulfurimonas sp.]
MKNLLFLLFFTVSLFSQNLEIRSDISYFEQKDINKKIDINNAKFLPYDKKYSNFGFTKSIYWLKVDILNLTKNDIKQVLHLPYSLLDYIDIYEYKDNKLNLIREYGDLREYSNDGYIPEPSLIITLQANESKTYFYKIQTHGSMNLELLINTYEDFTKYSIEKSIAFSFYFGATFIMLLYNFVLYLFIKDRSYLYYILFHTNYMIFALSFNGLAFAYIWPNLPYLNNFSVPLLMSIGSILAVIFTIEFLDIKTLSVKLLKPLKILLLINIIMSILVLFLSYRYSSIFASFISLISIVLIIGSGFYSHFTSKNPHAKFFILAWGILMMGIFIVHLRNIGVLPVNLITSYSPLIGAFFELVLLAIALSYRYNIQREEMAAKDKILYKQSRLASMGEMISNIAHQWRQPLNRINLNLAVIDKIVKDEKIGGEFISEKIKNSEKNIQYMSQTISDFTDFFAPDKKKNNFNIYDVIKKSLKLVESRLDNVNIHMPKEKNINYYGFENESVQILLVILNNAIDNFEIKNIKQRDIYLLLKKDLNEITLSICDNGGGIDEDNINYIFDPYFSTKFKKEGTGIGLYMAKMLVENSMHGELKVISEKGNTTFEIKMIEDGAGT